MHTEEFHHEMETNVQTETQDVAQIQMEVQPETMVEGTEEVTVSSFKFEVKKIHEIIFRSFKDTNLFQDDVIRDINVQFGLIDDVTPGKGPKVGDAVSLT